MNNSTDARVTLSMAATDGGNVYQVSRTLTLDSATDSDTGDYTCVADNGNAVQPSVSQEFELFVRGESELFTSWIGSSTHHFCSAIYIFSKLPSLAAWSTQKNFFSSRIRLPITSAVVVPTHHRT